MRVRTYNVQHTKKYQILFYNALMNDNWLSNKFLKEINYINLKIIYKTYIYWVYKIILFIP